MLATHLIVETARGCIHVTLKRPLHIVEIANRFTGHGHRPSCITLNGNGVATVSF